MDNEKSTLASWRHEVDGRLDVIEKFMRDQGWNPPVEDASTPQLANADDLGYTDDGLQSKAPQVAGIQSEDDWSNPR